MIATNVNEVIKSFIATESDRDVKAVYEMSDAYLICAPHKGVEMDDTDPFFIWGKETGKYLPFLPSEDPAAFGKMMNSKNLVYSKE